MKKEYVNPSSVVMEFQEEGMIASSLPVSSELQGDQQLSNGMDMWSSTHNLDTDWE